MQPQENGSSGCEDLGGVRIEPTWCTTEFAEADFNDHRLTQRLLVISAGFAARTPPSGVVT